ncbi:MAG: hypothetical protein KME05_14320 [Gloeocapsa sp. UFS-A4-WI-NPMV-4B04]|jgi:hypothetical protein|nr:hypothetical protein [Gloeocapsa sp. UFS-A4-WI-NPMV-4B04]
MLTNESNESKHDPSVPSEEQFVPSNEPEWEQERMSTLAGFEDKIPAIAATEETTDDEESLLVEEDPHLLRTQQSFQNNPFSKLGLVSLSTLVLVVTAGIFLSGNLMQSSNEKPREQQADPTAKKESQDKTDATDSQGRVLTDLALTSQGKELEALNEKGKQQPKTTEQPAKQSKPVVPKTSRVSTRTDAPAPRPRPRPVATYSPQRPVTAYAPPRVYTPPQSIPKPVVQPNPVARTQSKESPVPSQEADPMERWMAAAQLGSYGQASPVAETPVDADTAGLRTPVEYAALTVSAKSKQQTEPQTPVVNFDEETPILQEQPRQLLVPGSGAKAVLATPFVWDESEDSQSNQLNVVLAEPLLAADGSIALPAKTQLIVEARSLSKNGLLHLVAVAAIVQQDNQQYEIALPENAVGIHGEEGKPLIVEKLNDKRREVSRRNITRLAIGAIGQASTSSNSGGFSRSKQNDSNLLTDILEGGSDAILSDIDKRNEEAISAIEQRPDVLFLKAGTKVEVFVNSSAAIDVFGLHQPILESYHGDLDHLALANSDTFFPYIWEPTDSNFIPPAVEERQAMAWLDTE